MYCSTVPQKKATEPAVHSIPISKQPIGINQSSIKATNHHLNIYKYIYKYQQKVSININHQKSSSKITLTCLKSTSLGERRSPKVRPLLRWRSRGRPFWRPSAGGLQRCCRPCGRRMAWKALVVGYGGLP